MNLNENLDYEKIERIEKVLSEKTGTEVSFSSKSKKGICFSNSIYENLDIRIELEDKTYKILYVGIEYLFCEIPTLQKIVIEALEEELGI